MDINRAKEFCEALLQKDFEFIWSCPNGVRADRLDEELLKLMKRSGCHAIALGIESSNEREFKSIKKGETLEQVTWAARKAREIGMEVYGNFIIGLPYSTLDSVKQSVKFAKENKLSSAIFNLLVPFPGTEIYEIMRENGYLGELSGDDWNNFVLFGKTPLWRTEKFSSNDLVKLQKMILRKFYLRPKYIYQRIKNIENLNELMYWMNLGTNFLKEVIIKK